MRVQIEFDDNGEIRSVAGAISIKKSDGSEGMAGRIPRTHHSVIELEVQDVRDQRDFDGLQKLLKNYRVIGHPKNPRLERR